MTKWLKRLAVAVLALLLLTVLALWFFLRGSLAQLDGKRNAPELAANVTVTRDDLGVPSISGSDRNDVAYATGFVHAQDRFFQMDLLRRMPSGELSELFGEKALETDRVNRLHRFRVRATLAVQSMPAGDRQLLERYTAGINDGLNALGNRPFEYGLVGVAPRPWALEDSYLVAWAMYIDLQVTGIGRELARGWLKEHANQEQLAFLLPGSTQWDAPLDAASPPAPDAPIPARAPDWWGKGVAKEPATLAAAAFVDGVGSNNGAVAGSRSRAGGAIVSDDMHLGIKLPSTWYRLLLQVPGPHGSTRRVVGVSIPGVPAVVAGSNGDVAWGFTNSYGDYIDLVEVGAAKDRPGQAKLPGGWETPVEHAETILVKGQAPVSLKVRETSLGPILQSGGREYAVHWVAHEPGAVNMTLRHMEEAGNVAEALALAPKIGMPAQNLVVGDRSGNIGWTIVGPLPQRPAAPVDASYPLSANGSTRGWQGLLPAASYPSVRNPAAGQLVTANSRQLLGADAAKLGDGGFDLGARTSQARDGLAALGEKTDEQGVFNVMLDDRALFISTWRDRALAVLDAEAVKGKPRRAELARLLKDSWNGHASVDSVSYRASRAFMWSLYELLYGGANMELAKLNKDATMRAASSRWPVVLGRLLDEQPGAWLPQGYASWKALQVAALDRTIEHLAPDGKPLASATWGARNTAAVAHPIAGAVPALRKWLSVPPDQLPGDSNMPRVAGPAYGQSERMAVSPGREEQGLFNMPGGQSGHPLSPFFLAGHADWVAGKPMPFLPGPARHTLTFVK
ncbi:penicillin acylase family protein [Pseudoduganella violaceinigra]|uniref:penicillin acylase family protein n=1 Tax=Pseudoduganella violaceinigra TaxID=246602 RepID=UPI00048365B5|nr:penicillin acylase family protein [Pseudoduganella violaceinigra]